MNLNFKIVVPPILKMAIKWDFEKCWPQPRLSRAKPGNSQLVPIYIIYICICRSFLIGVNNLKIHTMYNYIIVIIIITKKRTVGITAS